MQDYKALSNKKLIYSCIDKDGLAWYEFVRRFKRLVYYAIEERLGRWGYNFTPLDAEDIQQDVFISIWEKGLLNSLRNPEKVIPWLAILSANKAVDYFRKKSQPPPRAVSLFEGDKISELADMRNPGPLDEAIFKDSLKNITGIIKRFSSKEKNILRLNILYRKSYAEIAKLFKIPIGSVSSIMKRAKAKIKKELKKCNN